MPTLIREIIVEKAAAQFGKGIPVIKPFGEGLIHRTYYVSYSGSKPLVLQCINQQTFPQPENIINNYRLVHNHLINQSSEISVPEPVLTNQGKLFWIDDEGNFWRATYFVEDSYSVSLPENKQQVFDAANFFARFTYALGSLDPNELYPVIPGFHNLAARYVQFENAISDASIRRLLKSTHLIAELRQRKQLVDFYDRLTKRPAYPLRVMHHDCKLNNILFSRATGKVLCAVDLDTVMPGYYFSDMGDMVRTMACTEEEGSTKWENINIHSDHYQQIVKGYLEGIGSILSEEEKNHIHHAGALMIYMQSIRFVTDFLNNDIYYHTTYPEQNLNRALNQFILLEKLEDHLKNKYDYSLYS